MKKAVLLISIVLVLSSCVSLQKWANPVPVNRLRVGQTITEVREFCRFPNDINTTVVNGKRLEQWVYINPGVHVNSNVYLYFENGILTAWQY